MYPLPNGVRWWYENLDSLRRQRGIAMDRMGLGPEQTPSRVVMEYPGLRLRYYGGKANSAIALIVPAPIKRAYIWDICETRSVVRHALMRGLQVYLIEWTDPQGDCASFGLQQYAYELIERCVQAIRYAAPAGRKQTPLFLLSHSLGGVFSAIYAALRPKLVAGLVGVEAPLHFAKASGSFYPLLAFGPRAAEVTRWFDSVPGSVLNQASIVASPTSFHAERNADFVASLGSRHALRAHMQVQRWTLDEAPMSRRLFEEVVELLYRQDRFMRGCLPMDGKEIGPADLRAPFLAVYDPRSLIIPPPSIVEFHAASASSNKRLLPYHGDTGTALAHVGALVGRNAHEKLWPEIFAWMESMGAARH